MNFILPVDFIDVSRMAATLVLKKAVHFTDETRRQEIPGSPHHDTQAIYLRVPIGEITTESWFEDIPHADTQVFNDWQSAQQVMAAIAKSHIQRSGVEPLFGKAMIVSLKAGGWVDWHTDQGPYAQAHDRFHVCLVPSAGALTFCGGMALNLPVGQLTFLNNRVLHSAVNFGNNPRIHLIVDVRKPEVVH
jgi:hypothetical protein